MMHVQDDSPSSSFPFFLLVINLLKFCVLEFLNILLLKNNISKYMWFLVLLKECSVAIQASVNQMRVSFFNIDYSVNDFFEFVNVSNLKF